MRTFACFGMCVHAKKKKGAVCFLLKKKILNTLSLADKYINAINTDLPRKYI